MIAGAEPQDINASFLTQTTPSATEYLGINTTSPIDGVADFVYNKTDGIAANDRYLAVTNGYKVASASFTFKYDSTLGSGSHCPFFGFHAFNYYQGIGIYNDGGNIKLTLHHDGTRTWTSATITAGTNYDLQYKEWRTSSGWAFQLRIYNYTTHALIEDSGIQTFTPGSLTFEDCDYISIGASFIFSSTVKFYFDNMVVVGRGAWAPQYNRIERVLGDGIGTTDGWTLGAGASKTDAVDDVPNDGDTSYIVRNLTASATQEYTNAASGISLSGSERITGWAEYAAVKIHPEDLIAFDAASNSGYQAAVSSFSWSHTNAGSSRVLFVTVSLLGTGSVSGITYNSVAMVNLGSATKTNGVLRTEVWYLVNPTNGTQTVAVTLSGVNTGSAHAISYSGAYQAGVPAAVVNTASGTGNPGTVSVTTENDHQWVMGVIATTDTAITASETQRANVTGALGSGAQSDTNADVTPAGAQSLSWTNVGVADTWAMSIIAIRPAAKGGVFTPRSRIGGVLYTGTSLGVSEPATTYTYARGFHRSPAVDLVVATDIDGGELGVNTALLTSLDRRCTQVVLEVAYGLEDTNNRLIKRPVEQPQIEGIDIIQE